MQHLFICGDCIMSKEITPVTEWKTIRIPAASYYKLVELSGFLTILLGSTTISISNVADAAVRGFYDATYPELTKIVTDPNKLEAIRKEIDGNLKRLLELWKKPVQ